MSFGRHRQTETLKETEFQKKIVEDVKKFATDLQKEIDDNGGELPVTKKVETKIEPEKIVKFEKKAEVKKEPIIKAEVKKVEEIKIIDPPTEEKKVTAIKKEIAETNTGDSVKKRTYKEYTNIGIIGDTVICRDFRAIVKKKGLQINTVLTKILHDWNTQNYNL